MVLVGYMKIYKMKTDGKIESKTQCKDFAFEKSANEKNLELEDSV